MTSHVDRFCRVQHFIYGKLENYANSSIGLLLRDWYMHSSRFFCNSLLYGLPDTKISNLQRVQDSTARLVVGARKYNNIHDILCNLHWLPIREWILFKILLLVYKSINGLAAAYIDKLLARYIPKRFLRSGSLGLLQIPHVSRCTTNLHGNLYFSIAVPTEWNTQSDRNTALR